MGKQNSIINSLKRLERVGEETSVVTQKLKDAAEEVADKVFRICTENLKFEKNNDFIFRTFTLPDDIQFCQNYCNNEIFLAISKKWDENSIEDYRIDWKISRDNALKFSKMIADGWLDKFADYLEKRKERANKAIEILEKAEI